MLMLNICSIVMYLLFLYEICIELFLHILYTLRESMIMLLLDHSLNVRKAMLFSGYLSSCLNKAVLLSLVNFVANYG